MGRIETVQALPLLHGWDRKISIQQHSLLMQIARLSFSLLILPLQGGANAWFSYTLKSANPASRMLCFFIAEFISNVRPLLESPRTCEDHLV